METDALDRPLRPKAFAVNTIITLNVIVYLFWKFKGPQDFLVENFLVSWTDLLEGRPWTLITSVFSHNNFLHLLLNMMVLKSFGTLLELVLGSRLFVLFYLLAGVISSLSHCFVSNFLLENPDLPALGASGSIAGLVLIFALMFPREKILLFGLIPLPALIGALAFVGLDLWGLFAQVQGGGLPIGHGAHLGGSLSGAVFFFFYIRPRMKKRAK